MSEASENKHPNLISKNFQCCPASWQPRSQFHLCSMFEGREGGLHTDWQLVFQKLAFNFRWTPFLPIAFVAICFKSEIESCFLLWITSRKSALINLLIFGPHFVPMTFFRNAKAIWVKNNVHKFLSEGTLCNVPCHSLIWMICSSKNHKIWNSLWFCMTLSKMMLTKMCLFDKRVLLMQSSL